MISDKIRVRHKQELKERLEEIWLQAKDVTDARRQVVQNLLEHLEVHPLSAPQYFQLLGNDDEDRPFLTNTADTGIPGFVQSLERLVAQRRQRVEDRLREQTD